tara:strand:+ start:583 stop:1131 length:549 start_codon:yes stop_codon:yes gene_type:complete
MSNLSDYIKVYDDVITKETCDHLISLYDAAASEAKHKKNICYDFHEINMIQSKAFDSVSRQFVSLMQGIHRKYSSHFKSFPETNAFEQPRIKRYEVGEGVFNWHTDNSTFDSSKRTLVMFFYLNDVEDGGETKFRFEPTMEEISVKPKAGSVLCFPPTWQYPHKGCTPISGPKYVISSYVQV